MRSYQLISGWCLPVHVDTTPHQSAQYWPLLVICAAVGYMFCLDTQAWSANYPEPRLVGLWLNISGFVFLIGTIYVRDFQNINAYRLFALGLSVCGICLFANYLDQFWSRPTLNSFAAGGLIPGSDGAGWIDSAWALSINKELAGMGLRRPLDTGLRVVWLSITGNLQTTIVLTTFIASLGSLLVAMQIQRSCGWCAAVAFFVANLYLIDAHLPVVTTEVHGFIYGSIALALFWRAATSGSTILWLLGLVILTIGLDLRPGPFLVLPAVLLFGITAIVKREHSKLKFLLLGIGAISAGMLCTIIMTMYWAGAINTPHPHFSYTLYGMVTGGQGWEAAARDYPGLGDRELMNVALGILLREPGQFMSFYLDELVTFVRLFIRYELGLNRVFTLITLLWLTWHWREPLAQLLLFSGIGIWLSAPFLMIDGGERVFSTLFPFIAVVPVIKAFFTMSSYLDHLVSL